jgi:hypothetical protein
MMADGQLVHGGQTIRRDGEVLGEPPPTKTLWFQWGAFHNCLLEAGDTAVDEWKALQLDDGTAEYEDAERELCQFAHGVPFVSKLVQNAPLDPQKIRKRTGGALPVRSLHADTDWLTIGVDPGHWTGWWFAIAFRATGELYCPGYGAFDVCRPGQNDDEESRLQEALAQFDEEVVLPGFHQLDRSEPRVPDFIHVDMNFLPEAVAKFVRTRGRQNIHSRWKPGRGRGKSLAGLNNASFRQPSRVGGKVVRIGTQWFAEVNYDRGVLEVTHNADHWQRHLQDRLRIAPGNKGALTLYRPDNVDASGRIRKGTRVGGQHSKVSNHLASKREVEEWDPEKRGLVKKWVAHGEDHWGDCAKGALVMGDWAGFSLGEIEGPAPVEEEPAEAVPAAPSDWYARRLDL